MNKSVRFSKWLAAAVLAMLLGTSAGCIVTQPHGKGLMTREIEPTTRRAYYRYLPQSYVEATPSAKRSGNWPVVVSFHGMRPFDDARPQAREWQQEADRYGFIVIAPVLKAPSVLRQFPLRTVTNALKSDEDASIRILDHVFATTGADRSRVLSTSWSSGGYMAHYMLNRHPNRFSALAVRQSNFSASLLSASASVNSRHHPIFIVNTENDFSICLKESRQAVEWYETNRFDMVAWIIVADSGHVRTPDLAAYFFSRMIGATPKTLPKILARRRAIDGNAEGIAVLSGKLINFEGAEQRVAARSPKTARQAPPSRRAPTKQLARSPATANTSGSATPPTRPAPRPIIRDKAASRVELAIRLSASIGIEPLHLGFSAECPYSWYDTADFLWSLDGQPIASGISGQRTLAAPGAYEVGLRVITKSGVEHFTTRRVRVLPRLNAGTRTTRAR